MTSNRRDILIIHHPTNNVHRPILFPAMGLLSIADQLCRNGVRAEVVHYGVEKSLDERFELTSLIAETGAKIIAFSTQWFFQLPDSLELARQVKQVFPELKMVFGGFSASFFAEELVEDHRYIDAVIRGDGEIPLLRYCRYALQTDAVSITQVPNLVYRDASDRVVANDFGYVSTAAELDGFRFSDLSLLRHYSTFLGKTFFPTKRLADGKAFDGEPLFPVEVGRGCPFHCTFCGGNSVAQKRINNRRSYIIRSVDQVVQTMSELVEYGCSNFYICFDPDPNGLYYHELFERIRKEKLKISLAFGCWGLPDKPFIDHFRETFTSGLLEISPESGNQCLRDQNKGKLSYSNEALEACVDYLGEKGLLCQLFFGYFLPGDTYETVMETKRLALHFEADHCESLYLSFSTDPGSLLYLHPQKHDVHVELNSLSGYVRALTKERLSPNLLAHRPRSMGKEEALRIIVSLNVDGVVRKVVPLSLAFLRQRSTTPGQLDDQLDAICLALSADAGVQQGRLQITTIIEKLKQDIVLKAHTGKIKSLICEMIDYESTPYIVLENNFSQTSAHYSVYCRERTMTPAALNTFINREDTVVENGQFAFDIKQVFAQMNECEFDADHIPQQRVQINTAVNRAGTVVRFYPQTN